MDVKHLNEFIVVADTCNFLEASSILYMSQSTLSRHIHDLEEELNIELFTRTTRKVTLTEYGQLFLPYAFEIYNSYISLQREISKRQKSSNVLTLGSFPAIFNYPVGDCLKSFKSKYPEVEINILSSHTTSVPSIDMLKQHMCELSFVREFTKHDPSENDGIVRYQCMSDYLVVAIPKTHPLANRKSLQLADLKHERIVTLSAHTDIYANIHSHLLKAGIEPNVVMTDHSGEQLMDAVRLDIGIGLLLACHTNRNRNQYKDLTVIPIEPKIYDYISLCCLNETKLSPLAEKFLTFFVCYQKSRAKH